jgi:hypothetical protein
MVFLSLLSSTKPNKTNKRTNQTGISFLPLDKSLYLRVQSFVNSVENAFFDITYTCFLYNYQLVWSGLEQDDLRTLYRYLTTGFNEACMDPYFASGEKASGGGAARAGKGSRSGFLIGPDDLTDSESPINVMRVFIGPKHTPHFLVVYKVRLFSLSLLLLLLCLLLLLNNSLSSIAWHFSTMRLLWCSSSKHLTRPTRK